ncbi:MAG TPA: hydrogenase maturation protease [Acidobacteriota bacterium]|nr:hydrogenase maturation protease [Acidobacteriota bacterium]
MSTEPIRQSGKMTGVISGSQASFRVVGLGTWLSSDDAVGLAMVSALSREREFHACCTLLENADAAEVASALIEWDCAVILVDAADMRLPPGACRFFLDRDASLIIKTSSVSTHGLGLAEGVELAKSLGFSRPVGIFGIQPFDLTPGHGLTPEMNARFPLLLDALRRECSSGRFFNESAGKKRDAPLPEL